MMLTRTTRAVLLLGLAVFSVGTLRSQDRVIDESFEEVDPEFPELDGAVLLRDAEVIEDERGLLLSLTQGTNGQSGFAWFEQPFSLSEEKVTIEFDLYIRSGSSNVPADGISVIFQFGNDTSATGGTGGGLGTSNFPTD
jgi:hypothetical protein